MNKKNSTITLVKEEIDKRLKDGYSVADLKDWDERELNGYAYAIVCAESAFATYFINLNPKKSVIDKIKAKVLEEIWEDVYEHLICDGVSFVHSVEDSETYQEE